MCSKDLPQLDEVLKNEAFSLANTKSLNLEYKLTHALTNSVDTIELQKGPIIHSLTSDDLIMAKRPSGQQKRQAKIDSIM